MHLHLWQMVDPYPEQFTEIVSHARSLGHQSKNPIGKKTASDSSVNTAKGN